MLLPPECSSKIRGENRLCCDNEHLLKSAQNLLYSKCVSAEVQALVQMWDVRIQRSVRSIFGPFICGRGLAVMNEQLITTSWRDHESLQAWDIGSGRLLATKDVYDSEGQPLKLYSAQYASSTGLIAGGSSCHPGAQV